MTTKRRSTRTTKAAAPANAGDGPLFLAEEANVIPGELLVTLAPPAAAAMTASVPLMPVGPVDAGTNNLGVEAVDEVLAGLGVRQCARLALPSLEPSGIVATARAVEAAEVLGRSFRVRVDEAADLEAAVADLNALDDVEHAELNRWREASAVPDDSQYAQLWGLPKINAPQAWDTTTGDPSVVVAVIDSGADLDHPDLLGNLVDGYDMVDLGTNPTPPPGFRFEGDFSGRDATPEDEVGHGTHVAGTIAAVTNNALGVAGVAWQCKIMPIKGLTRMVRISDGQIRGVGSSADIAAAIRYAADHGASVINMSLGSPSPTTVEESAIAYAVGKGCVVVAAMGNDGTSNPSYPAAYPGVVAVGASNESDMRASFSQTGDHISVVAPGVGILSTDLAGGYGTKSGTSMATPHVAGVAALIRSVNPGLSGAEVGDILRQTARALRDADTDPVPNPAYGHGLVDAAAAVARALPAAPPPTSGVPCLPQSQVVPCLPLTRFTAECLPRTIAQPDCLPPTRFTVDCLPRTVWQRECLPRTIWQSECLPPTRFTVDCLPPSIKVECIPNTALCLPPSALCLPPTGGQRPGFASGAQAGQRAGGAGTFEDGYAAGYRAGMAAAQAGGAQAGAAAATQAGAAFGPAAAAAAAAGGSPPRQGGAWSGQDIPLSVFCGETTRIVDCAPNSIFATCFPITQRLLDCPPLTFRVIECPPRTRWGVDCPPIRTLVGNDCPPDIPVTPMITRTFPPTIPPTTPWQVQRPGYGADPYGYGQAAAYDPYGQGQAGYDPYGGSPYGRA